MLLPPTCLFFGLPVCQSNFNGWFRSLGKYRATLEFKSSGCAVSNNQFQSKFSPLMILQKQYIQNLVHNKAHGQDKISIWMLQLCCNSSLSNSNYFTLAKKCRRESCIIDFMSTKMKFALAILKKMYFSKYSIKYVVNRLPPFKNLYDHTNRFLKG